MRTMQRMSRGKSGSVFAVGMTLVLLLSLSAFMVGSPATSAANGIATSVTRDVDRYSFTIGEVMTYTNTYTVPAYTYLEAPLLYDEFSNRGVRVVAGSSSLQSLSGTPTVAAAFASSTEPVRNPFTIGTLYPFDTGFSFEWELGDIDNSASDTPYVFTLTYAVHFRGTMLNDSPIHFPPTAGQWLRSASSLQWFDGIGDRTAMSARLPVQIYQPALQLEKAVLPLDVNYAAGQNIRYVLGITNIGWSAAYDMTVDDVLPAGFDWSAASYYAQWSPSGVMEDRVTADYDEGSSTVSFDLHYIYIPAQGETLLIVIDGEVPENASADDLIANTADVDWSSLPGDVDGERIYDDADWEGELWTVDTDTADLLIADAPHIKVTSEYVGALPPFQVGDDVVLDITLKNTGTSTSGTIDLLEVFDDTRLRFVEASVDPDYLGSPAAGSMSSDVSTLGFVGAALQWQGIAGLAPGETWTVRATFEAIATGYAHTTAQTTTIPVLPPTPTAITPQYSSGDLESLDIPIYDPAGITFAKGSDPTTDTVLLPGDVITYYILAENNTGMDLEDPACIEELPDSVDYVPGSMVVYVNGWDVELTDEDDGDGGTYDPTTHTITFLGTGLYTFEADDEVIMTFDVEVGDLERSYQGILNQADLMFNDQFAMASNEVYHFVDPIRITKTGVDVNGGRLVPGDEIEWTITVENVGLAQTTNVVISDAVPTNTTYVAGSIAGTGADDSAAPSLTWDIGVLPVAGKSSVSFRSTVDEGLPAGTIISNQASVTSDNSTVAFSDDAMTEATGDATLLRTGGDEITLLAMGALVIILGSALVFKGRKALRVGTTTATE